MRGRAVAPRVALHPIDLRAQPGESIGLLGHNGAGKTTLLRLLAGVTLPSSGRVRVEGRIGPLISVGVGFHQELSGLENVLLNGQLLGLSKDEVKVRLPSIIDFSELDDVLDVPVKFYSAGMLLRLAFAVLVHLEADVMLVDEILAVGDVSFQAKCLRHLRSMLDGGSTVILVSHSPQVIQSLCSRGIVMDRGSICFDGPVAEAVSFYHQMLVRGGADVASTTPVTLGRAELLDADGRSAAELEFGRPYRLRRRVSFHEDVESPQVYFNVFDAAGELVYQRISTVGKRYRRFEAGGSADLEVSFIARLGPGRHRLVTEIRSLDGRGLLSPDAADLVVERAGTGASLGSAELGASIMADGEPGRPIAVDEANARF